MGHRCDDGGPKEPSLNVLPGGGVIKLCPGIRQSFALYLRCTTDVPWGQFTWYIDKDIWEPVPMAPHGTSCKNREV